MSSNTRACARWITVGATVAVALGCHVEEPFARTNHWDAGGDAKKTLVAPDSTFAIGDTFTVTLTGIPPLPPGTLQIEWVSNGALDTATQVFPAGYGKFVVVRANAAFQVVPIAAEFDEVSVGTFVMVGQTLASLDLYCGTLAAQVACDATPLAVNGTRLVSTITSDRNTNALRRRDAMFARMTAVSRDASVLAVVPPSVPATPNMAIGYTVRGVSAGATWLVVSGDGVRDSVRVIVGP